MNFKLKGNSLMNTNVVSPKIVYAEFSDEIEPKTIKTIVETLNSGHEMLRIYEQYRDFMHINNILEMIQAMESVFKKYDYKLYEIKRGK